MEQNTNALCGKEPPPKSSFYCPLSGGNLADVINNADLLFSMHPAPWRIKSNSLDGYVVDANNEKIFGGEYGEGYVCQKDNNIVALVDVINSLWVYMKGEK